jgi:hypothetical protein
VVPATGDANLFAVRMREMELDRELKAVAGQIANGESLDGERLQTLQSIDRRFRNRFGSGLPDLSVRTAGWQFDWKVADFVRKSDWREVGILRLP